MSPEKKTTIIDSSLISGSLIKKYATHGPRYTSYPTAVQFDESFGEHLYKKNAHSSNDELLPRPISIYIHIPFCHSLCYFCGCNKIVTQTDTDKLTPYLEALYKEIELKSKLFDQDRLVKQIHFGGGTPNFLSTDQYCEVLKMIANKFHLDLPGNLEISTEIDPRYIEAKQIEQLCELGINRFSIGVQDFSDKVQQAINRVQTSEQVLDVIHTAQRYHCAVSVDLITGLPHQTKDSFLQSLSEVTQANVGRIALYNFAWLPEIIKAQKMIDKAALPDAQTRQEIVLVAQKFLQNSGYQHIGMDHFALPEDSLSKAYNDGSLQRNFQGYTTCADSDLIGFGVSAISQYQSAYAQNNSQLSSYVAQVNASKLATYRGIELSHDDLIRSAIIQDIMCKQTVDFEPWEVNFGIKSEQYFASELLRLKQFEQDNLLKQNGTGFVVTETGRYFLRNIAMIFDHYLQNELIQANPQAHYSQTL